MRGTKAWLIAILSSSVVMQTPPVIAAGSNVLRLSTIVVGTCKVTSPPGILDFGSIDPSGSSIVTAVTTFSMKCTKGTISTAATDSGGLNFSGGKRMRHSASATEFLPYAIIYSADAGFAGQGFGAATLAQTVTVSGTVTTGAYRNALVTTAGQVYSDVVTITINP
jgi:hypothetical protein